MASSLGVSACLRRLGARALLAVAIGYSGAPVAAQDPLALAAPSLRGRVEALRAGAEVKAGGESLRARSALPRFYESRGFELAWTESGRATAMLDQLLTSIASARAHGLVPGDYHQEALVASRARVEGGGDIGNLVDLDLLATDAFLLLGSHFLHGRVNPETIDPEWLANRRTTSMDSVLIHALDERSVGAALEALLPRQPRYHRLVDAAARLRLVSEAGGWPRVPEGPKLEVGVVDERVVPLRARLKASGDLPVSSTESRVFDEDLAAGVRRFQSRHGLEADGVVGAATVGALNVPAMERANTIEVNLERWRWLPEDLGARHFEVNIASFGLDVVERGHVVRSHRAVVGRQCRQTPMFSGLMTYLVLSPYWHVPPTIAAVDKLPLIKKDPGYLGAQRMTLLDQSTNQPVDAGSVAWGSMTGPEFNRRYRLRQEPGPWNALGSVKFMFPNKHNVYMHDTPSRELFDRTVRSFSSGCIRVDDPLGLAGYLLSDQPQWTEQTIRSAAAAGTERAVRLSAGVPVHLLYWTAWADQEGTIHFREDLYGRDAVVARALAAPPPEA